MTISANIHNCESIRCASHDPTNANCISLKIETADTSVEVTLFDLPKEYTDKLLSIFPAERVYTAKEEPQDADAVL